MTTKIRSRIHEFFTLELMKELYAICRNSVISDNNLKVSAMVETMRQHRLDFVELGPGTNRLAILIDNYVFKLALDKWGLQDNLNEFTVSQELQPYVVKTYETNELISVCEYVTVISREEFQENKDQIREVLAILAESYLLGDVGTVNKNFTNWGYRDNGDLVVLDFAYIYRVQGDELLCSYDQSILEYDENFHKLKCPSPTCNRTYTFMDLRRRITMEQEKHENDIAKQFAFKLTEPIQEFKEKGYQDEEDTESSSYNKTTIANQEDNSMRRREEIEINEEEQEDSYLETLELMKQLKGAHLEEVEPEEDVKFVGTETGLGVDDAKEPVVTNKIEIQRETPTEKSQIRIITQSIAGDTDGDFEDGQINLEPIAEMLLDTAAQLENVSIDIPEVQAEDYDTLEEAPQFEEDNEAMTDEDVELYNIIEEDMAVTTVSLQDVDNDGQDEIVIDTEEVPVITTPSMINISLEDDGEGEEESEEDQFLRSLMEADIAENPPGELVDEKEEVIYTNTIKVTDNISIENSVKFTVSEDEAERLRQELMGDVEGVEEGEIVDEERIEELADDYSHLQEEAEDELEAELLRRRGGNKNWK